MAIQMTGKPSNIRVFLPKDATAKYLAILSEVQKYQREIENDRANERLGARQRQPAMDFVSEAIKG
jgi:hypothetical protein